jgi:hypothetical protein
MRGTRRLHLETLKNEVFLVLVVCWIIGYPSHSHLHMLDNNLYIISNYCSAVYSFPTQSPAAAVVSDTLAQESSLFINYFVCLSLLAFFLLLLPVRLLCARASCSALHCCIPTASLIDFGDLLSLPTRLYSNDIYYHLYIIIIIIYNAGSQWYDPLKRGGK